MSSALRRFGESMANRYAQATRRQLAVLALVALVAAAGAILRACDVVDRPVWEDEAYTWKDSQVPLARLVWWKHDPVHGPASHLLVRLSMAVFGTDAPFFDGAPQIQGLLRAGSTAEELRAIERDNTVRIVPRLSA